jgi:hypothetical protein
VDSATHSQAGRTRRADSGRAARFVAELGPAGFRAGEARVGTAGGAARRSVADVGSASGHTSRSPRGRRAGSYVGIAGDSCPGGELGLAYAAGSASRCTGAFLGRTAASVRAASSARASTACASTARPSSACASTACCRSACGRPFLGRAGRTSAFMGRPRGGCGSTGRTRKTGFPDSTLVEPAGSGVGPAQARGPGPGALFGRLGSAPARGGRAAADRRAIVGGARHSGCTQVGYLERAGSAGVGHAEDRRARRPGGAIVGSSGRASG